MFCIVHVGAYERRDAVQFLLGATVSCHAGVVWSDACGLLHIIHA